MTWGKDWSWARLVSHSDGSNAGAPGFALASRSRTAPSRGVTPAHRQLQHLGLVCGEESVIGVLVEELAEGET